MTTPARVIDLSFLTSDQGFIIQGDGAYQQAGGSVSLTEDVNGDGIADIIVGARFGPGSGNGSGDVYVVYGQAGGTRATVDLTNLDDTEGYVIYGDAAFDLAGFSVSGAGDVNGDGIGDILIGARDADEGGTNSGAAYVIYGLAGTGRTSLNLTGLSISPFTGYTIQGDASFDNAGFSVSGAGDINGDGIDDFIVGAQFGDDGGYNAGEAYVIYGQDGVPPTTLDLSTLTTSDGFIIQGDSASDVLGHSVSSAGDINGDGIDDLIVGAPDGNDGGSNAGEAYVIYGQAGATRTTIDLTSLAASDGFIIQGDTTGDQAGYSVSGAGDVNGDGVDDLIVGAPTGDDGGSNAGEAYVIYGTFAATRSNIDLTGLAASDGFVIQGDVAGDVSAIRVSAAGDVNSDGFADLIVGARDGDDGGTNAGEAYVVYGQAGMTRTLVDLTGLQSNEGFIIQGDAMGDLTGSSVSVGQDVNGDGVDDIVIGAPNGGDGGGDAGEAYVIYGVSTSGFGAVVDLTGLGAEYGFVIQGDATVDYAGYSVSMTGDVNGDGLADMIVGALLGDDGAYNAGEAYVIYGQTGATRTTLDLSNLTASDGYVIEGAVTEDRAGASVSGAGDVNGDGIEDLIVGATLAASSGFAAGESYVVYGQTGTARSTVDLNGLAASDGFAIQGGTAGDVSGYSVSGAGDVNGDGIDDVIVGAPFASGSEGEAYVIYGQAGSTRGTLDLSSLSASEGYLIRGELTGDYAGSSVSDAGNSTATASTI